MSGLSHAETGLALIHAETGLVLIHAETGSSLVHAGTGSSLVHASYDVVLSITAGLGYYCRTGLLRRTGPYPAL